MTSWQIYWITRLDNFNVFFTAFFFMPMIVGVIALLIMPTMLNANDVDEKSLIWRRWAKRFLIYLLIEGGITCLIPSSKEMAAIIILPKIVNNERVQEIPNKLLDLATSWLEDLRPKADAEK